jgi:hypothetical protein
VQTNSAPLGSGACRYDGRVQRRSQYRGRFQAGVRKLRSGHSYGPDRRGSYRFRCSNEHHVLPFIGQAYIGCLRHEKIIGLSKFTRIVRKYACRFTVQERIAQEIANELERIIEPHGVIVHLRARHSCTECRGVREMGALTRTIERRGNYVSNYQLVAEFMSLAGLAH